VRIVVSGATGFIGSYLVPYLVGKSHEVIAIGRDRDRLRRFCGAEKVVCDLLDSRVSEILPRDVDAVVHLAQASPPPTDEATLLEVNVGSTEVLLTYARRVGAASFVFASSGSVYGVSGGPLSETDVPRPGDAYARSKLQAEQLVRGQPDSAGYRILRLFAPYGPGQRGRIIPDLLARVQEGRPITIRAGGRPRLNPIYVDHVVDVFAQALSPTGPTVVNVGGAESLSILDMTEVIGRVVGRQPRLTYVAESVAGDMIGDTAVMRQCFRLPARLTTFEQGIRAMTSGAGPPNAARGGP
jgi:nucleoside-diphosphate-sugar epimerase